MSVGPVRPSPWDPPFFSADRPEAERPVVLTGPSAFALVNGAGEISLPRETRGASIDWGGAYGEGVRLTGPWRTRVIEGGSATALGRTTLDSFVYEPGSVQAHHSVGPLEVRDSLVILDQGPGLDRTLSIVSRARDPVRRTIEIAFEPFLAPVLIEGVRPLDQHVERHGNVVTVRSHGFAMAIALAPLADVERNGEPWSGAPTPGPAAVLGFRWDLELPPATPYAVRMRVTGGTEASIRGVWQAAGEPGHARATHAAHWGLWTQGTPELSFPDAPALESAYRSARAAIRMLYTSPRPDLTGLLAGFPWYSAIWGRDLAWMLPAVAWLGDWEWAQRALSTVFRFQAGSPLPILGGEAGELPMQVSPGPIFLYGTSDTTLYFPGIVRDLADRTGRLDTARDLMPSLLRILEWGDRKSDARSGLFTNGGEVAVMRHETDVGRVHVGFDAVDTTIWDSTDRRDHAIDVEVLWAEALDAVESLSRDLDRPLPDRFRGRGAAVRETIGSRYLWPEEEYLYDSLRADLAPVRKVRPNALRAVRPGFLPPDLASRVVRRAARDDLTTPWGVRTLSARDPSYHPQAYHDGQVWSIATAWAAEAALRAGEADLGASYLATLADRFRSEGGFANECYRGDRPEPFNSCFLLGLSVAPFVSTLFSALWGIEPHLGRSSVTVEPRFPRRWGSAGVSGLALGSGRLSLVWKSDQLRALWEGPEPLEILTPGGSGRATPGAPLTVAAGPPSKSS